MFIDGFFQDSLKRSRTRTSNSKRSRSAGAMDPDRESRIKGEVKELNEKTTSRETTHMKIDDFSGMFHSTPGDPNIMARRVMRTSSSDSDAITGLEIWRHMAVTYAGSTQIRVVTFLKQIMTPTERTPKKSANVLQMYHHWLELISKYESFSSEKISYNIKHIGVSKFSWASRQCSFPQHQ